MNTFDDFFLAVGAIVLMFVAFCVVMIVRDVLVSIFNHLKSKREQNLEKQLFYGDRYNRDTTWGTLDGREIPIRCLEDTHLANVIAWVSNRGGYSKELLKVLHKEAKLRKLSDEFLLGAPYPFKDVDGKWKKGVEWVKGVAQYRKIGR